MNALCISAIASNSGKTILTTALLHHFKEDVRAFKIGPDYIDPQFHEVVCKTPSINLDTFIMNEKQVKWLYKKYANKNISILEGVMGFYDGRDKGCSAYDVSKLLNIPTILLLDGSGSYITISAVLKGLKIYTDDNTIKAVVLNKLSSSMHYELIKKQILNDFDDVEVLGFIKKDLPSLKDTHLGLDLEDAKEEILENISKEVLQNIDIEKIKEVSYYESIEEEKEDELYPFTKIEKINKKISIIKDENFSFIYHDNCEFLKETFKEVEFINACKNESISEDSDIVYLPGGYVETQKAYDKIKNSNNFKNSLLLHAKTKYIYAECAGLLYLAKKVDDKIMSGLLDVNFELKDKRSRLGYYYSSNNVKGHSFHYTNIIENINDKQEDLAFEILSKKPNSKGKIGSWRDNKIYGTYLHTMFRNNINILKEYFGI